MYNTLPRAPQSEYAPMTADGIIDILEHSARNFGVNGPDENGEMRWSGAQIGDEVVVSEHAGSIGVMINHPNSLLVRQISDEAPGRPVDSLFFAINRESDPNLARQATVTVIRGLHVEEPVPLFYFSVENMFTGLGTEMGARQNRWRTVAGYAGHIVRRRLFADDL